VRLWSPLVAGSLVYVTQVAPYRDGPAGAHSVLEQSATAVGELAGAAGLSFVHARDVTTADVSEARVLALFTIGETPWSPAQRQAILSRVRSGALSVVAIHAATDSCYGWDEYLTVVGARFNGHPWTQDVNLEVCEPNHPALVHLGATWPWHDEVYQFRDLRADARILLRVDPAELDLTRPGVVVPSFGFPLSWCFAEGGGRVFSTSLGHFPAACESVTYLRHLAGGLAWALGEGS
jgi:type 1 glutamine amidotransferase